MATERFGKRVPNFFLSMMTASTRICNFLTSKHTLLSNALGKTDTKSVWYSFSHIESLYKELVYLNADGIRVYMGAYEAGHADFAGQLCLIMVPTRLNGDTMGHEDVILEEDADFTERPGNELFTDEETAKAFNYGAPCPTICPALQEAKYPVLPCS